MNIETALQSGDVRLTYHGRKWLAWNKHFETYRVYEKKLVDDRIVKLGSYDLLKDALDKLMEESDEAC